MKRFQQLIQRAIAEGIHQVLLEADRPPFVVKGDNQGFWQDLGTVDGNYIRSLFQALLRKTVQDIAVRGEAQIPNFGRLMMIAEPLPTPRLKIFLPDGHYLFPPAWEAATMNEGQDAPPPQSMAAPEDVAAPPASSLPPPPDMGGEHEEEPQAEAYAAAEPPPLEEPEPPAPPAPAPIVLSSAPAAPALAFKPIGQTATGTKPAAASAKGSPSGLAFVPNLGNAPAPTVATAANPPPPPKPATAKASGGLQFVPPGMFSPSKAKDAPAPLAMQAAPEPEPEPVQEPEPELTTEPAAPPVPVMAPAAMKPLTIAPMATPLASAAAPEPPLRMEVKVSAPSVATVADANKPAEEKPLDRFLRMMLKEKASDLHLTTGEPMSMRIDGEIRRHSQRRVSPEEMLNYLLPMMPDHNKKEFEDSNDTDFAYEIKGLARFRINVFRDRHGIGAVLRHIPNEILSFSQLGLPQVLKSFCKLNKGFVVVTGPTGSGKSTTLAAMVDYMNRNRHDHILTIEDPIEFVHPQKNCLIRQREIKRHTTSFSRALRAALREDPDIILVGELRDLETTAAAIEMAETGHLVMGTLHTTTAISTVDRIIDQFPADQQAQIRVMLAESLKGVVAQTLLRKKEGGRVAALEILVVNQAVSSLIREAKSHMIGNHMQSQRAEGNVMLNDALTDLVLAGLVEPEQAWLKAINKAGLIERFKTKRIDTSFLHDKDPKNSGDAAS